MKQDQLPTQVLRSTRKPRGRRRVLKILLIAGLVVVLLGGGTAAYVNWYVHDKFNQTHDKTITAIDPCPKNQACNFLVLGSDRRDVVDPSLRHQRQYKGGSGSRADTLLVIHVAADQKSAVVLSFPRDLRVKIPGKTGYAKINSAYAGGPNLVIKTVKALTGLSINHYVEVNFAGFQAIVDAVGGVRLCTDRPYNDKESGLILPTPGCRKFDGKLALAYVRMRKQDPRGDFGRIERQQQFIRVLMSKVTSIGFLTDIPRLFKLANAMSKNVKTDSTLGLGEVKGIANKLAGFKQSHVDFRTVPSFGQYIGGTAYVIQKDKEASALYAALRLDKPLPPYGKTGQSIPQPKDISVSVLNGTTTAGLAKKYADYLTSLGYHVVSQGNADRHDYKKTTILFSFGGEAKAQLIQDEFPNSTAQEGPTTQKTDIVVILGSDTADRVPPSPG